MDPDGSNNECRHPSFLSNTTSHRGVDPVFSYNNIEELDGSFSKSLKNLSNNLIVWFKSAGYK
jgi:hypothetical protein